MSYSISTEVWLGCPFDLYFVIVVFYSNFIDFIVFADLYFSTIQISQFNN